jgi:hypothetical protein
MPQDMSPDEIGIEALDRAATYRIATDRAVTVTQGVCSLNIIGIWLKSCLVFMVATAVIDKLPSPAVASSGYLPDLSPKCDISK